MSGIRHYDRIARRRKASAVGLPVANRNKPNVGNGGTALDFAMHSNGSHVDT
jgi:hypothetical protein